MTTQVERYELHKRSYTTVYGKNTVIYNRACSTWVCFTSFSFLTAADNKYICSSIILLVLIFLICIKFFVEMRISSTQVGCYETCIRPYFFVLHSSVLRTVYLRVRKRRLTEHNTETVYGAFAVVNGRIIPLYDRSFQSKESIII